MAPRPSESAVYKQLMLTLLIFIDGLKLISPQILDHHLSILVPHLLQMLVPWFEQRVFPWFEPKIFPMVWSHRWSLRMVKWFHSYSHGLGPIVSPKEGPKISWLNPWLVCTTCSSKVVPTESPKLVLWVVLYLVAKSYDHKLIIYI